MLHDDETERRLAEFYGPPDERDRKQTDFIADLVERFSNQGVRSLLAALGQVDGLLCTDMLRRIDLAATPLAEILRPFEPCGLRLDVDPREDGDFDVEFGGCWLDVGDGLRTVARRSGDGFVLVDGEAAQFWIA
ncbi:hypothetical protein [Paludisphaera soli]|uniref:hypothetical protein n=1 Tax=Paludisphaera soli TaxID=2712865 RepID=UPI0013EAD507|nr:hypothetical protein [Paludisphaera soli]